MKVVDAIKLISDTLWKIETKKGLSGAIEDILTPGELIEIADRINILKMLSEGKSQRDIANELGISVTTVSRGNRLLQYDCKSIHKYI